MDANPDAIVVGGGPAGCMTASLLAPRFNVLVLEDHEASGVPVQCTGLVSDEVLRLAGTSCPVLNSLYGARVHFPGGGELTLRTEERKAVVIDRSLFDSLLAEKAMDAGAEFLYSSPYVGHALRPDGVDVLHGGRMGRSVGTRLLVGADGQNSRVCDRKLNPPREWVRGLQVDLDVQVDDPSLVDIFMGSDVAPGLFAWSLPGGDFLRVGLCCDYDHHPPNVYLRSLLRRLGLDGAKVLRTQNGRIPLGGRPRSYGERLLLVGDAAGQVKPVSGGGLQPGLASARCLAATAEECLRDDTLDARSLSLYEKRWKKAVGKELRNGYRLRKIYVRMTDDRMDEVFDLVNRKDVLEILQKGDIDHPSSLAPMMLRHLPALLRFSPLLLGSMLSR